MNKEDCYAEIMHMFRYTFRSKWAPSNIFEGKSRLWVQAFNDLVKKGFIKKRKKFLRFEYRWVAKFPEGY
tara:strand:+ start:205 stop:414 length:210 start_codon:yes stop_codon:yes gene_type:complete